MRGDGDVPAQKFLNFFIYRHLISSLSLKVAACYPASTLNADVRIAVVCSISSLPIRHGILAHPPRDHGYYVDPHAALRHHFYRLRHKSIRNILTLITGLGRPAALRHPATRTIFIPLSAARRAKVLAVKARNYAYLLDTSTTILTPLWF